jgi:hypothetical protein
MPPGVGILHTQNESARSMKVQSQIFEISNVGRPHESRVEGDGKIVCMPRARLRAASDAVLGRAAVHLRRVARR